MRRCESGSKNTEEEQREKARERCKQEISTDLQLEPLVGRELGRNISTVQEHTDGEDGEFSWRTTLCLTGRIPAELRSQPQR